MIKQQTSNLSGEIGSMRKFIEDLHISVSEKDAEIIKLKMHLGDERQKQSTRNRNESMTIPEHDYQDLIEENSQLRQSLKDLKESHAQEIRHLKETLRSSHTGGE